MTSCIYLARGICQYIDFLLFVGACILVIIPSSVGIFFLRSWLVRKLSISRLKKKYQRLSAYGLNPFLVPERLHHLIPLASKWGISDREKLDYLIQIITSEQKMEISRALRGCEQILCYWLKISESKDTPERQSFMRFANTAKGLGLLSVSLNTEIVPIGIRTYRETPNDQQEKQIYYAPRPRTRIERFIYGLFTAILFILMVPVGYFIAASGWNLIFPDYHPDFGIAIVSISAGIFPIFCLNISKQIFQRVQSWRSPKLSKLPDQ